MSWLALILSIFLIAMTAAKKTPQQVLYSILREALKGLRYLHLFFPRADHFLEKHNPKPSHHSPYKRMRCNVTHFPLLLNLPTSDGSGEAAHPDVLYAEEGWGKGKWAYLMTATPYPSGNDYFENPEFYVSYDGLSWKTPAEGGNPVANLPAFSERRDLKKEFHSDPSLLLHGNTLYLYYRWSGLLLNGMQENRIRVFSSEDGIGWKGPATVLEESEKPANARKFLSPSLLFLDGNFVMWTVEYLGGRRFIVRRTSPDGFRWSEPSKTLLHMPGTFSEPWHLDVAEEDDRLLLLLTTAKDRGHGAELHWGWSDRSGTEWHIEGQPFVAGYFFEGRRVYRSSLLLRQGGQRSLYYSTMSEDGTWNIGLLSLEKGDTKFKNTGVKP